MDDCRLQGLGRAVPWKQALFPRKGSWTKETKSQRMENKIPIFCADVEGAAGKNFLTYSECQ